MIKKLIPMVGLAAMTLGSVGQASTQREDCQCTLAENITLNQYNDAGEKHGKWVECHANGKKKNEHTYVNGKVEGFSVGYYDNGHKAAELFVKNDIMEGHCVMYYENGQKHCQGLFKNGKQHKIWEYWDENGQQLDDILFYAGRMVD